MGKQRIVIHQVFHFKNGELGGLVTVGLETQRARPGRRTRVRVDFFQERSLEKKYYIKNEKEKKNRSWNKSCGNVKMT